jgi:hypothetical protein
MPGDTETPQPRRTRAQTTRDRLYRAGQITPVGEMTLDRAFEIAFAATAQPTTPQTRLQP